MEQGQGDGRRGERRVLQQGEALAQAQAQARQPQKCPRCDSMSTKFCYYNNYSLSQPRYFCKTCRRYWTQGGALRNVPVGGGSRKAKRARNSSASSTAGAGAGNASRPRPLPQQPPQEVVVQTQQPVVAQEPSAAVAPVVAPFYQGGVGVGGGGVAVGGGGGGYLAALNPSLPFDQSVNVGGDAVHSYVGLLSGFDVAAPPLGFQSQSYFHPSLFYPPVTGGSGVAASTLFNSQQGLVQSTMANVTSASHHGWSHQPQNLSFMNNAGSRASSDAAMWSTFTPNVGAGNSSVAGGGGAGIGGGSFSVVPDEWPDVVPGYDAPPPPPPLN